MAELAKRTRLHRKLTDILNEVNSKITPMTLTVANEKAVRAKEIFDKFEEVQEKLETTAADSPARKIQEAAGDAVERTFCEVRGQLRSLIDRLSAATSVPRTAVTTTTPAIKLPVLPVPEFSGDISDWPSFKDLFTAAVINNKHLTDAQRLQYLKSFLRGEAANLIKFLTTSDVNYSEAWTTLNNRYDNKRELAQTQISKILDLKQIKSENAKDLQGLVDQTVECLHSLQVLGCPVDEWDDILVVIISRKLDPTTRREWARQLVATDLPKFKTLRDFLGSHIRGLQAAGVSSSGALVERRGEKPMKVHNYSVDVAACIICSGSHIIHECPEFLPLSPAQRSIAIKKNGACFNCLRKDHIIKNCPSPRRCKRCNARHHTLLHEERKPLPVSNQQKDQPKDKGPTVSGHHVAADQSGLLMTAVALVHDKDDNMIPCRVFIDGGSEGDFITKEFRKRVGANVTRSRVRVTGAAEINVGTSTGKVKLTLHSQHSDKQLSTELLILDKITGRLPKSRQRSDWGHLNGLQLADNKWYESGEVDILLGIKYYNKVMMMRRCQGPDEAPIAWETIFGWCIAGVCSPEEEANINLNCISLDEVNTTLKRFWEVEEPPKRRILTTEEKFCESHFINSYRRDQSGRFVVGVPFNKEKLESLGRSRDIALRRLRQVERRLQRKPELHAQYAEFMREYAELGHMTEVPQSESGEIIGKTNYLCHHFVTNDSSTTTKLRVVFDGSAETTTGVSLNSTMYVGATLQDDLYDLLLRFRTHAVVLKADIAKMFRQFKLHDTDAEFHRILWRAEPTQPVKEFRLTTVTYGTACAPNLATRCVQQLGFDCAEDYPMASKVLINDTYVDDVLTGHSTEEEAIKLQEQLVKAVATAGLDLRKWTSNSKLVLESIPEAHRESSQLIFDDNELVKALGVQWHPASDNFRFKEVIFDENKPVTKRSLLSDLARVFDPLGLISCIMLKGKLLLQELWKLPLEWDDRIPLELEETWKEYKRDLALLTTLKIPRRITVDGACALELHGFSDSSETALGGIIYLRNIYPSGQVEVKFITSKTKVAPIRQITLPRLELCAAVLTAELMVHVKECLQLDATVHLWSDSTITLTWIAATPRRWKTFVANRVATIQELTLTNSWRHVAGTENPADLASRGSTVEELNASSWWWRGPEWLSRSVLPSFPAAELEVTDLEERTIVVAMASIKKEDHPILARYSSLTKLHRVTAWFIRYLQFRIKRKCHTGKDLTVSELKAASYSWIRHVQANNFTSELQSLKEKNEVGVKSRLKSLHPFIDGHGVMRVSGRLRNAQVPVDTKHQIILPRDSHLTTLVIEHFHRISLHSGFQLTWSAIQTQYWIIGGRDRVRYHVRNCVKCRRWRAKAAQQLMGELPGPRVSVSQPFAHTGVDYAGPFFLKDNVGKVPKTYKGYICLFVCLATKALYLEVASSLSTEAFLAAFRRFVSRRSLPSHMYSDCGTNFVGADKELRDFVRSRELNQAVSHELSVGQVSWHFNPPAAPHFGGLWESAVKSAKHHLRRVMGGGPVTYEQFATLLAQIEAVLNSRPLSAMSSEPGDLQPLTPGHFLVGGPLIAVPDEEVGEIPRNRLSQFQRVQQQLQHFWQRWSREYLCSLQQRTKWMWDQKNVKVGDLVLLVEETAPGTWKMGRVVEIHPGDDGRVRVVTVKTATSTFKRAVAKIVPLICDEDVTTT